MVAAVASTQQFTWAGSYPLAFSTASVAPASGAAGALIFFSTGPGYDVTALIPTVVHGSKTAYFLGAFSNGSASAGSVWCYYIDSPDATGTLSVSLANNYIGDGRVTFVSLTGTATGSTSGKPNAVGAFGSAGLAAGSGGGPATASLVTTIAASLLVGYTMGIYGGTPSLTSSTPTATVYTTDNSVSNMLLRVAYQLPTSSGLTASETWTVDYNQSVVALVEIKAGGVAGRTGASTGAFALTNGGQSGTVASAGPSSTGNLALTRVETATVLVTGQSTGNFALSAVQGDPSSEGNILTAAGAGTRYNITRSGSAQYYDALNVMQTAAANAARAWFEMTEPRGVMVEEAGANTIKDNTGTTAVVGGAFPTGAGFYNGGVAGLTCSVAAIGVEDGINYVDYRFQGTNSSGSAAYPSLNLTAATDSPVAAGDIVTLSAYIRIVAGTYLRADQYPMVALQCNGCDATGAYVASMPNVQPVLNSSKLVRDWSTFTVPSGGTVCVNPLVGLNVPAGTVLDFTIRVGLPQVEKKARPTSPIKTTGTVGSRGAESMSYLTTNGTKNITVEYVGYTGLVNLVTYASQVVTGGAWPVPAVAEYPYVKRISSSVALAARARPGTTAMGKGWNLGAAFKLSDYTANASYATILKADCSIYCPEYEFKMDQVQPTTEGTFVWTTADNFAAQAVTDGKTLRGHAMIWYAATPSWCATALSGSTTARWQGIIDSQASHVIPRWNCNTWDVVNEVIEPTDGISGGFRNSVWYQAAGSAYIAYAFQRAAAYNTYGAKLHLAEYGTEEDDPAGDARRTAVLNLVTSLVQAGVPIDGVSLQCHLDIERPFSATKYATFLQAIKALGLNMILSEIDVRAPAEDPTLEYDLRAAHRLREVLDVFMANTTGADVLFWDFVDTYTWLSAQFPSRTERPLPYDTTNAPKAMYAALQESFEIGPNAAPIRKGTSTASFALTAVESGTGAAVSTGVSTGNLALTSTEAAIAVATGVSTGGLALTKTETAIAVAGGTSTAALALTSAEAGTVLITGAQTANLAATATEYGTMTATGQSTGALALSAIETGVRIATGTSTALINMTSSDTATVSLGGQQTATMAVSGSETATVSITAGLASGLSLSAVESGSAPATAVSTGSLSLTSASQAGAAASGSLTSSFALTAIEAAQAIATGQSSAAIAVSAVEASTMPVTGQSTGNFVLTAPNETVGTVNNIVGGGGWNMTATEAATVSLTGAQSSGLLMSALDTGNVVVSASGLGGFVLTASGAAVGLVNGASAATISLGSAEAATALPISFGVLTSALSLTAAESGNIIVSSSSVGALKIFPTETATVIATGGSSGNLALTAVELSSVNPLSIGTSVGNFTLVSTDTATVAVVAASSAALNLAAAQAGNPVAQGSGAGALRLTAVEGSSAVSTGVSNGSFSLGNGGETATVSLGGSQIATLAIAATQAALVLDAAQQNALLTLSAVETASLVGSVSLTSGFALTGAGQAAVSVTGASAGPIALRATETAALAVVGASVGSLAFTAAESTNSIATGVGAGGFTLFGFQNGQVPITAQQSKQIVLGSLESAVVPNNAAMVSGLVLGSVDAGSAVATGSLSSAIAFTSQQSAGLLNPIVGASTGGFALSSVETAQAIVSASKFDYITFGASGAAQVFNFGRSAAVLDVGFAGYGGVLITGNSISSYRLTGIGLSFSDNNIRSVGPFKVSGNMRGLALTLNPTAPPSSVRTASVGRETRTALARFSSTTATVRKR